jgi:hypothetical protein
MTVMTRTLTVIFAIATLWLCPTAQAQNDQTPASVPPAAPGQRAITFDPDAFKIPNAPTDYNVGKTDPDTPQNSKPDFAIPNKFDLGKYSLHVGTANGIADLAPKPSIDPSDGLSRPTSRVSPLNKSFYGLTLTAPIH